MSRIVPKLNLNKTPQLVENNSLVMAKNIRLLEDGTIGPDTSLKEVITKTGEVHTNTIHHDAVTEELVEYQYTILDVDTTITYRREGISLDENNLEDVAFDFVSYLPPDIMHLVDEDKYVKINSDIHCTIYCYTFNDIEPVWTREQFTYNPNEQLLLNNNGYCFALAVRQDIWDEDEQHPIGITDYYYCIVPKHLLAHTIEIRKYNYFLINPVYSTSESETIVISEAWDEVVITTDTPRYLGQIVGLDNKIYFFVEELAIQYSQEAHDEILEKYPNECFVNDKPLDNQEVTFDVNDDNYVTRRRLLFEDREIAEAILPAYNDRIKIYEYDEVVETFTRVKCAWRYSGGKINGCVTVNGTGEPILTICEYDVPGNILVPIKHINLSRCTLNDNETFYTQAPNIPITNLINVERYVKNIPAGVYQFFIRYKIHDDFYTNWFPCSKELFAATMKQTNTLQGTLKHIDLHLDSNYSFMFQVEHLFDNLCYKFEQFQLGFIVSSEGGVFARSWKHFDMNINNSPIYFEYNQEDIKEINIDELLKVNYDIFNVKNIVPYKNKLYIANYTETDFNEELSNYASQINIKLLLKEVFTEEGDISYYFSNLPLYELESGIYNMFGNRFIKDTFGRNDYCEIEDEDLVQVNGEEIEIPYYQGQDVFEEEQLDELYYNHITKVYTVYNNTRYYLYGDDNTEDDILPNGGFDNHSLIDQFINEFRNTILGIDLNGIYKAEINSSNIDLSNIVIEYVKYTHAWSPIIPGEFNNYLEYGGWQVNPIYYTLKRNITLKDIISSHIDISKIYREYNTLLPFTKYDFYVHYVKKNGIVTNGYYIGTKEVKRYCKGYKKINSLPSGETSVIVDSIDDLSKIDVNSPTYISYNNEYYELTEDGLDDKSIIYPTFDNIVCPLGYVACFISISKYNSNVAQAFNVEHELYEKVYYTRLDCLEFDCLLFNVLDNITIIDSRGDELTNEAKYYCSSDTNPIDKLGCSGYIEFITNQQLTLDTKLWIKLLSTNKPYNKTLIKLTPYIKLNNTNPTSYGDYDNVNSPGYLCEISKLDRKYCDTLNIDGTTNSDGYYVSGSDVYQRSLSNDGYDLEEITTHLDYHYNDTFPFILSNFNLNYVSLTSDINPIIRRYNVEDEYTSDKQFLTVVDSLICSFILELKSMYKDYTRKLYYEYTKNKLIKFDNTIRSSNVDIDEAYRYIYRFEATDYYNVPTQRGIITNLISIANSIYVHCEHSLFKFSDNKTLNAESEEITLQENDIFNSGITEVFDAQYGYAGLKKREQSLITYNAYIFYDEVAQTIYAFGGEQQIGNISEPIKKLIKAINPTDVQFLGDEPHNRFFVNFRNNLGNVCLSFNFNAKYFISVHDFDFKFGFHSRRNSYLVNDILYNITTPLGWTIYKIVDNIKTRNRRNDTSTPSGDEQNDYTINYIAYQACYKNSLIHIPDCDDAITFNEVKSANACVDIICNTEYEAIKVLNYISWICSEIQQYGQGQNNVSEEIIDRHYPAHKIRIYSDSTETSLFELLDSNGNPKIANENSQYFDNAHQRANSRAWQYPQYNCGVWSMNYFRDVKNIEDVFDYKNPDNEIIGEQGHETTVDLTPKVTRQNLTQENSLLYGKYFVVRFIFNNKNFKLENVILRMNDYGKTK